MPFQKNNGGFDNAAESAVLRQNKPKEKVFAKSPRMNRDKPLDHESIKEVVKLKIKLED